MRKRIIVLVIIIVAGLMGMGAYYLRKSTQPPHKNVIDKKPADDHPSPDNSYTVIIGRHPFGGYDAVLVVNQETKAQTEVLGRDEASRAKLDEVSKSYAIDFNKWLTNDTFEVFVTYNTGKKYTFTFDAKALKGVPESLKVVN